MFSLFFFFNDTATTEIYTLSLQTLFRSRERELLLRLLRLLHEALGATGALLERRRFERHRLELRELGPQRVVARRVVAGRSRPELALEVPRAAARGRALGRRPMALLRPRPELSP